jgi:tetratricopeptide (TPR) repeat protein
MMFSMPFGRVICVFVIVFCGIQGGCYYADYHVNKGVQLQGEGELEAAIENYTRAIDVSPDSALAYYNRACAEREMGDLESALADYRADLWSFEGDYAGAIRDFTRVIELDPVRTDAFIGRGIANMEMGEHSSALSDYTRAIAIDPYSVAAFINRADLKIRTRNLEGAINDYSQAIRIEPENAAALYNRGIVRERKKDYAAAIRDYEQAASLSPELASKAHQRIKFCWSRLHRK